MKRQGWFVPPHRITAGQRMVDHQQVGHPAADNRERQAADTAVEVQEPEQIADTAAALGVGAEVDTPADNLAAERGAADIEAAADSPAADSRAAADSPAAGPDTAAAPAAGAEPRI